MSLCIHVRPDGFEADEEKEFRETLKEILTDPQTRERITHYICNYALADNAAIIYVIT